MTIFKKVLLSMAVIGFTASPVFAEDAPVYDVDSYPAQFDGQNDPSAPGPAFAPAPSSTPIAPMQVADNQSSSEASPPSASGRSLNIDQRVARLEQQINNALHTDLATKVNDMQTELQALRGQVEEMSHQLQLLQAHTAKRANADTQDDIGDADITPKSKSSKLKTASADVSDSASGLPATSSQLADAAAPADTTATADQPNVAEEQQIYQSAYSLIKAKKYSDAADTLKKMLQKYPSGQFAANAHYWLGELYGLMGKNDQSIAEFGLVVKRYPDSPKIADAQLKLGLIYAAQLKWPDAKSAFKKVINHYPGTSSAHLASEQLKQIKQDGH